jgi:hypothetical protein
MNKVQIVAFRRNIRRLARARERELARRCAAGRAPPKIVWIKKGRRC